VVNFFARLTHSHPGRVVWVIFNTLIALMLMELNVFSAIGKVLGLYSNIAIAWDDDRGGRPGHQQADGLVAQGIEFKRRICTTSTRWAWAMGLAIVLSIVAYLGFLGPMAQAFSP